MAALIAKAAKSESSKMAAWA